ncbi:Subtilisin [Alloactinosynnema sp. L-07]|uniref:S8 family serine peptidase n=1 Tax=Alloactinosynnema sp. L-07 TaxID=1653480 RepID=UPI00065EFF1B|nr:S8 family serine peptidase [Alloactinosynnema sp. L-07]CRK57421.1 Subtilisin [Alloactinosynnema sp. L-07]
MTNPGQGGTTGRYLVLMEDDAVAAGTRELNDVAGIRTTSTADAGGVDVDFGTPDGLVLHQLGVAVVNADPDQVIALARAATQPGPIALIEEERRVYAISAQEAEPTPTADESLFTWGLQAVGAQLSTATGEGIRLCVLDTGFDIDHPDFAGRVVTTNSFVQNETVRDGHGHGTHCIGTAAGPRDPAKGPGYGVAYLAEIYAGKVLSNRGSGTDGGILSGIAWAITNGCPVVSMSLGAATRPGDAYSQTYETVAKRAMAQGTMIIAAAGNESRRQNGQINPVGHPANCPSIMAVGAVDVNLAIAWFSCGTVDRIGSVDIVGPGVDVYSSWPTPLGHNRISGTSMATPHVAGVAALTAQATGARSWELWARLSQTARRLPLPSTDVGGGLVQAP